MQLQKHSLITKNVLHTFCCERRNTSSQQKVCNTLSVVKGVSKVACCNNSQLITTSFSVYFLLGNRVFLKIYRVAYHESKHILSVGRRVSRSCVLQPPSTDEVLWCSSICHIVMPHTCSILSVSIHESQALQYIQQAAKNDYSSHHFCSSQCILSIRKSRDCHLLHQTTQKLFMPTSELYDTLRLCIAE